MFSKVFSLISSLKNHCGIYTNKMSNAITTQGTVFGVFQALYFRRPAQVSSCRQLSAVYNSARMTHFLRVEFYFILFELYDLFIASFVKGSNPSAYKNNLCLLINFNHYQHGLCRQIRLPVKKFTYRLRSHVL